MPLRGVKLKVTISPRDTLGNMEFLIHSFICEMCYRKDMISTL